MQTHNHKKGAKMRIGVIRWADLWRETKAKWRNANKRKQRKL